MANMSTGVSLSSVLNGLIQKYSLNALELERLTGVPSSTLYRLLKGKDMNPTVEVLKKLSSFFQITVSQLIGEDPIGCKQVPLVQPDDILSFLKSKQSEKHKHKTVPVDFPLNTNCFATVAHDEFMEPFISVNSIIIVDPDKEVSNKDFVMFIKKGSNLPQIRQALKDGSDMYLKILNAKYSIEIAKLGKLSEYDFLGVIIHYRTNLINFNPIEKMQEISVDSKRKKKNKFNC